MRLKVDHHSSTATTTFEVRRLLRLSKNRGIYILVGVNFVVNQVRKIALSEAKWGYHGLFQGAK